MRALLLAAWFAAFSSHAHAQDAPSRPGWCGQLRRAVTAAHDRPAFASIAANPGANCSFIGDGDYRRMRCEWRAAPETDQWLRLNATVMRCFPNAIRMAEPDGEQRNARFRFGLIAIHTEHRDVGMRGGSFISYTVMRLPVH